MIEPLTLRERILGSLTGLLVGDALGVPYEFHPPEKLPVADRINYVPPPGFSRAHVGVPPGTWSDDGAQALVLLDSLLTCNGLDLAHFAAGLLRWARSGFCAVDGRVFDVGIQTSRALGRLDSGISPERAGPAGERDNGNGSLMRVLPIALWHRGSDEELVALAMRQSLPTHGHPRAQIACAFYCLWARETLAGSSDAWAAATERLCSVAVVLELPRSEIDVLLDPAHAASIRGSGYVVDSLWSARAAVEETESFESCVRYAVRLGHDTDTTAAVAGGIAGARYGLAGIPSTWVAGLRGEAIVRPLITRLLQLRDPTPSTETPSRTSLTHPLRIAELPIRNGIVGVTLCPGKKQRWALSGVWERDLDLDLKAIHAWGASHVVTLVEEHELVDLGVKELPTKVEALGIRWHHVPIKDQQAPDAAGQMALDALLPRLVESLEAGERVLVHCMGGLGRAGTVAALLMLTSNEKAEPAEVIASVRHARPGAIETRSQQQYIERYRLRAAAERPGPGRAL